jgi:2-oxoglutarate ferredoxin oxidoreductase subunit alpha
MSGKRSMTATSGPGISLKAENLGVGYISEVPLVVVNVMRGGPSTGLPTKTEQSDLMQALWGRNGESPMVVIAASSPSDCFDYAFQAAKIALERMTPVMLLTDGFLGNGSEPWRVPLVADMPEIKPRFAQSPDTFKAYRRTDDTLAREWAFPGMDGFEHRIGGLEKDETGTVSHDPANHQYMCELRAKKVANVVEMIPDIEPYGCPKGDVLIVGWGGTFGHLVSAARELCEDGKSVGLAHFNYINPLPGNTEEVFSSYKKIIVCELNLGQFVAYLRDKLPQFKYEQYNKVMGLPFSVEEIKENVIKLLED